MSVAVPPESRLAAVVPSTAGGVRAVIEDAISAALAGEPAALALVLETEGSTYVACGALAQFGASLRQTGWLSGGCLEPEIEAAARACAEQRRIAWIELDTRDDAALFSGEALGCRGRLRIALLPLREMEGLVALARRWLAGEGAMEWQLAASGEVVLTVGVHAASWMLASGCVPWPTGGGARWRVSQPVPPAVLVLGAGPEAPVLLPLLRRLGFATTAVEARPRWRGAASHADVALALAPALGIGQLDARRFDAALVMHHGFELDLEALAALAPGAIPFVGLLGPRRRRDDLLALLSPAHRAALETRLRAPIGAPLGGHGPEAIALSIAAQLQSYVHAT